jgi:hypothetical protein
MAGSQGGGSGRHRRQWLTTCHGRNGGPRISANSYLRAPYREVIPPPLVGLLHT